MSVVTGLNVPPTQAVYPFTQVDAELRGAVADLYFWTTGDIVWPLQLHLLENVGSGPNPSSSSSAQGFDPHIILKDEEDSTVFDSDDEDVEYTGRAFSSDYWVHCWESPTATCRLLQRLEVQISDYEQPVFGILDARVGERGPHKVKTITANDVVLDGRLILEAGYNVSLVLGDSAPVPAGFRVNQGVRSRTNVRVDLSPGAGPGRYDECGGTTERLLRHLSGVAAGESGNVQLDASGCYWVRPPSETNGSGPSSIQLIPNTLQIGNDCGVCCECDDYVNVYRALKNLNESFLSLGATAENTRAEFLIVKAKWLVERECRKNSPVQLILASPAPNYVIVTVQVCNLHDTDCQSIELTVKINPADALPVEYGVLKSSFLNEQWYNILPPVPAPGEYYIPWWDMDPGHSGRLRMTLSNASRVEVSVTAKVGNTTYPAVVKIINSLPSMSGGSIVIV